MTNIFVEINLDEHCSNSMTSGSKRCSVSNHQTLMSEATHQGAHEVLVLTWHDVNCKQLFFFKFSNLHAF
jgi:hypothetical protein